MRKASKFRQQQAGFTLIELMIVVAILTILMGGVFRLLRDMQVRNTSEQDRLEVVQPGREVLDQVVRELSQAGVPSARLFIDYDPTSAAGAIPGLAASNPNVAVGLTQITATSLTFEGDVDGDGQVDVVTYQVVDTGDGCPCLQRSQITKAAAAVGGTPTATTILANVALDGVTPFVGIRGDNNNLITNATYSGNAIDIANIKKVQITLPLRSSIRDIDTRRAPTATMQTTVNIRNCSPAYINTVVGGAMAANGCF